MIVRVGWQQASLLIRGRRTAACTVMAFTYAERRACRRLERRGLLAPVLSFPDLWKLTEMGERCPLKWR